VDFGRFLSNLKSVHLLVHPVYLFVCVGYWPIFFHWPFFSLYPERSMQLAFPIFLHPSPYLLLLSLPAVFAMLGWYVELC
jgi:hypothetical protein